MEINLFELLDANPILLIFSVIGLGYLAGNIRSPAMANRSGVGVLPTGLR
jgi:hypothetical protein